LSDLLERLRGKRRAEALAAFSISKERGKGKGSRGKAVPNTACRP